MAIAKVVYKESSAATPSTWMDVTQKTVTSATMLSDVTALKNDGTNITGTIAFKNATNLTASASTVTVASGYYSSAVTKNVDSGSIWIPSVSITAAQYISLNASTGVITAEANGNLTGIIPFTSGYISSVSNIEATAYGYSTYSLNTIDAHSYTPTETEQTISSGHFLTGVQTIKAISSTYVGTGVPTLSAAIIFPSTSFINIESGQYITGIQTFAPVKTVNLEASYIVSGITVKVGDDYNASRIAQVTGTYEGGGGESLAAVYKSLAYRSMITSNATLVSEWCNSLSEFNNKYMFAGQPFSGDFTFTNVTTATGSYCFAHPSLYENEAVDNYSFTLSFPNLDVIPYGCFLYNTNITQITCNSVSQIQSLGFYNAQKLESVSFPNCTSIGSSAFYGCRKLTTVDFSKCTIVGTAAFISCSALTEANFSVCTTISPYAFSYCRSLTTISFPSCIYIRSGAFLNCNSLAEASFPECTGINYGAFSYCINLSSISFPKCLTISSYAFANCSALTEVNFSVCSLIGSSAFTGCINIGTISFPKCEKISSYAFNNCSKLSEAYFMNSVVASAATYMFNNTPIANSAYLGYWGSIYVPSSLLATYQTATNWATYSARMVGI